jgi:hypothetical protein
MYRNHDYFGDGSVHNMWRPLTIQTIWCSFFFLKVVTVLQNMHSNKFIKIKQAIKNKNNLFPRLQGPKRTYKSDIMIAIIWHKTQYKTNLNYSWQMNFFFIEFLAQKMWCIDYIYIYLNAYFEVLLGIPSIINTNLSSNRKLVLNIIS